jgi:phosphoglycolate phosphatase-like HAD superfamily hydrolase
MNAVIFDIDGTLIESMDFDTALYTKAVKNILGDIVIHYDWNYYRNVTDSGILSEILKENGYDEPALNICAVRSEFGKLMAEYLHKHCISALPGAVQLLQRMKIDSGFAVGIATGGWGHTARLKLAAAGLDVHGIPLCSSDDSDEREGIMKKCLSLMGSGFDAIYYVGDADWDIAATQRLGWEFIGIGQIVQAKCQKWVMDFKNESAFLNLMS